MGDVVKIPHEYWIGKKIGRLTVISGKENTRHGYKYNCQCSCGNITVVYKHALKKGETKSCGCLYKETRIEKSNNKPRKDIKPKGMSGFNYFHHTYKRNAKLRNLEFSLTTEQFYNLTKGNCHYCHIQPSNNVKYAGRKKSEPYVCNGVDRVDNSLGYTVENSVSCCSICNRAKGTLTNEVFEEWIKRLIIAKGNKNV
jgi:hypothetical protein